MRSLSLNLALAGLLAASAVAKADTFNFSLTAPTSSISGTLTGTSNSNGSYTLTGINATSFSGSVTAVSGLLPTGNIYFTNDNLLFPSAARTLDINGFAFTETMGGKTYQVNVFSQIGYNPPTNVQFFADSFDPSFNFAEVPVTFTVSAVAGVTPEPSSLLLLGTGMLGAVSALRLRVRLRVRRS